MTSPSRTAWQACVGAFALALVGGCSPSPQSEADKFLATYEQILGGMYPIVALDYVRKVYMRPELHGGAHGALMRELGI